MGPIFVLLLWSAGRWYRAALHKHLPPPATVYRDWSTCGPLRIRVRASGVLMHGRHDVMFDVTSRHVFCFVFFASAGVGEAAVPAQAE